MLAADTSRPVARLLIREQRRGQRKETAGGVAEAFVEVRAKGATGQLVERLAVPPPIHVGFAEAEGAPAKDAGKKLSPMNLKVPRSRAVDLNVGLTEMVLDELPCGCHRSRIAARGSDRCK